MSHTLEYGKIRVHFNSDLSGDVEFRWDAVLPGDAPFPENIASIVIPGRLLRDIVHFSEVARYGDGPPPEKWTRRWWRMIRQLARPARG